MALGTSFSLLGQLFPLSQWVRIPFLVLAAYYVVTLVLRRRRMKGSIDPPGPRSWTVLGQAYEFNRYNGQYLPLIVRWAKQYGPITQFYLGTDPHVIISDHKIAKDLFVFRGSKYGDRGAPHVVHWATMDGNPSLRPRDEGWRRQRTCIQHAISSTANRKYRPIMDHEANLTLSYTIQSPESAKEQLKRFAYSSLTHSLMGFPVTSPTDPFLLRHQQYLMKFYRAYSPIHFPSNIFGIFRKFPSWLIPNVSTMKRLRNEHLEHMFSLRNQVEETLKDGRRGASPYEQQIMNRQDDSLTDDEVHFTYQALLGGGAFGPYHSLLTAITLLVEHPEWQNKLQSDIDRVVGQGRLPRFDDIPHLPLLRAVFKESVRYRGLVTGTEVPRMLAEDDHYGGYFFAKGTTFHMNFPAILSDSDIYPDAQRFNPARYLDPSYPTYKEPLTTYPNCQNFPAFGYGRRQCPGVDFAEQSSTIMLLKICWAFSIVRPLSKEGEDVPSSNIMDWNFELQPRDRNRVEIIRHEAQTA